MEARQAGVGDAAEVQPPGESDSVTDVGEPALMAAPPVDIDRGSVLAGRYQIEAIIGRGGSGVVLRAFDRVAKTPIAIKILKGDLARDPHWMERFSRELRLARQIQHPNVCRVFDIGEADGHRFLTMELAAAGTLRDDLKPDAPLRPLSQRLADVNAVISGLAAIHAAGIVHRDIKPDNLLRMNDGRLVLSDFGLATNPSEAPVMTVMVGTPTYMAPEVVFGEPATVQSDVWALGVVIYELIFGRRPAWQTTRRGRVMRLPDAALMRTSAERRLAGLCQLCLADGPADRPSDAGEVAKLLAGTSSVRFRRTVIGRSLFGFAAAVTVILAASFAIRHLQFWAPASASAARSPFIARAFPLRDTNQPTRNLTQDAQQLVRLDGKLHCVSVLPGNTSARLIWGEPRHAEDVDLSTGARRRAKIENVAYSEGCPQLASNGELLYMLTEPGKPTQIMYSRSANGTDARALTVGTDPIWRPGYDEFIFTLDEGHAALFSLTTMDFKIVENQGGNSRLVEKAITNSGGLLALRYLDGHESSTLVLESVPDFRLVGRWDLPSGARHVSFAADERSLTLTTEQKPELLSLDWSAAIALRLGSVSDGFIQSIHALNARQSLLATRTARSDVWIFDSEHRSRPLTSDGVNYSAAPRPDGVLVQKRLADGRSVIYLYAETGDRAPLRLTEGPFDAAPAGSPDGATWFYADYDQRSINRCGSTAGPCVKVFSDEHIPTWPAPSPDGRNVAYITILGGPRLHVRSLDGDTNRDLGATATECPPVWTDRSSLWVYRGQGAGREWAEINLATGEKSGRTQPAGSFSSWTCDWSHQRDGSAFYRRIRVVPGESFDLWRLPDHLATTR
jgi:serine/threonine-protein kinase